MHKERQQIIVELIRFFDEMPEVTNVKLRGSELSGKTDRFSDIDLLIEGSSCIEKFAGKVVQCLQNNFEIEFFDWATSLLPNEFVVTFYLKNTSIFWNVDLQFISNPNHKPLSNITNNPSNHLLKLWILNLKYLQRRQFGKVTLKELAKKVGVTYVESSYPGTLREVFTTIKNQSDKSLVNFLSECEKELEIYENQTSRIQNLRFEEDLKSSTLC